MIMTGEWTDEWVANYDNYRKLTIENYEHMMI